MHRENLVEQIMLYIYLPYFPCILQNLHFWLQIWVIGIRVIINAFGAFSYSSSQVPTGFEDLVFGIFTRGQSVGGSRILGIRI